MKAKSFLTLLLLFGVILFQSCTIQKRIHRKGWHVEWKQHYKKDHAVSNDHQATTKHDKKSAPDQINTREISTENSPTEEPKISYNRTSNDIQSTLDDSPDATTTSNEEPSKITASVSEHQNALTRLRHLRSQNDDGVSPSVMVLFVGLGLILVLIIVFISLGITDEFLALLFLLLGFAIIIISIVLMAIFSTARASSNLKKEKEATEEPVKEEKTPEEKAKTKKGLIFISALVLTFFLVIALLTKA